MFKIKCIKSLPAYLQIQPDRSDVSLWRLDWNTQQSSVAVNKDSVRDPPVNQWGCERLNMFFTLSFKTTKKKKIVPYLQARKLFGMRRRLIRDRKFGKGV